MEKQKEEIAKNSNLNDVPEWLREHLFNEFLEKDFKNFHKIKKFSINPAVSTGENYMTVMLRITIELELKNGTDVTTTSYMVKIKPTNERLQFMIKEWKIFFKECNTYKNLITAFENYYKKVGRNIKLAPLLLEPTKTKINDEVLILEDLRPKGFKNYNRHLGLDLEHTKAVLKKLAQFHAASAHHFMQEGPYLAVYDKCFPSDEDLYEDHRLKLNKIFLENLDLYGNFTYMKEKLKFYSETMPDPLQLKSDWETNEFNVLNHGDCWTNNIMFQYDQDGQLNDTLLIDFQISRFGTPAQDLYYFLLSSTNLEIKTKYFDKLIHYYHQQLTEHLKLLQYKGKLPLLRDIHMELFKHDYWAYFTISSLMPVVLFESRDDANIDNLLKEDDDSLKRSMYTSELYVRNMNILMPWLNNRGAFDI